MSRHGLGSITSYTQADVVRECARMDRLKAHGKFLHTPDEAPLLEGVAMLAEEAGEVARAAVSILGFTQDNLIVRDLYTELVQVSAVATMIATGLRADSIPDVKGSM